ncbi:hypothetical protein P692DRAFT_20745581, partial [Suillus brevipes Sb2]
MAASTSTSQSTAISLAPPVALVVSDQELPHDGSSVVSTCVLRKYFGYFGITRVRLPLVNQFPLGLLLPVTVPNLAHLIDHFSTFTREQYTEIACAHSIAFKSVDRKDYIRDLLRVHQCDLACAPNLLVFKHLKVPRRDFSRLILPDPFTVNLRAERNATQRLRRSTMDGDQSCRSHIRDAERHAATYRARVPDPFIVDDPDFPTLRTFAEKMGIIEQWQHEMSAQYQERGACAVCAHNICARELKSVDVHKVPLHLLRNDCLPEHTLPSTYDFDMYGRAVLYPKGMTDCWSLADLLMCGRCHSALVCKCPRQPVNSLANFQYYGHEKLPDDIRDAFARASAYDLMLIARARASQITHFYAHKPSGWQNWLGEEGSQRYNKGNVAIRPQDSTQLRTLLPP